MKYLYYGQKFLDDDASHLSLKDKKLAAPGLRIPGGEGLFFMKYVYDSTIKNKKKHGYLEKKKHLLKHGVNERDPISDYTLEGLPILLRLV